MEEDGQRRRVGSRGVIPEGVVPFVQFFRLLGDSSEHPMWKIK